MKKFICAVALLYFCLLNEGNTAKYIFVSSAFPGIAEHNSTGELSGLGVDVMQKIAEELAISIEIKIYPFNRMLSLTKNKSVDGVFGIYKNPERAAFLDYIEVPFFTDSYLFYTNHTSQMTWQGDMAEFPTKHRFCWVRGWAYFGALSKLKPRMTLEENSSLTGCLKMLIGARYDFIAGPIRDINPLLKKLELSNYVRLLAKDKGLEGNYIAFAKGHLPELQQRIKQALKTLMATPWYQQKLQQYGLTTASQSKLLSRN